MVYCMDLPFFLGKKGRGRWLILACVLNTFVCVIQKIFGGITNFEVLATVPIDVIYIVLLVLIVVE